MIIRATRKIQPTASIKSLPFKGIGHKKGNSPTDSSHENGDYAWTSFSKKSVKHKPSIGQFGDIVKILGDTLLLLLGHRNPIP